MNWQLINFFLFIAKIIYFTDRLIDSLKVSVLEFTTSLNILYVCIENEHIFVQNLSIKVFFCKLQKNLKKIHKNNYGRPL